MAHGFMQHFDKRLNVASAGTHPSEKVNAKAVEVMQQANIDISRHIPEQVDKYLNETWDYVITVCDDANETCPAFLGKVKKRLHIGFEDPSHATGTPEFIHKEFIRIRDQIRVSFYKLYIDEIKPQL
jgi:arsenate reductase